MNYDPTQVHLERQYDENGKFTRYVLVDNNTHRVLKDLKGVTPAISQYYNPKQKSGPVDISTQVKVDYGTFVHKKVSEWIKSGLRGWCDSRNVDVQKAVQALESRFPVSEGWDYDCDVGITDGKKFGSEIDILAINKRTGENIIVDLKTGKDHELQYNAQMAMYRRMWELQHPGQHITSTELLRTDATYSGSPFRRTPGLNESDLNRLFAGKKKPVRVVTPVENLPKDNPDAFSRKVDPLAEYSNKLFTVLDIETGGAGEPVSVSAIKYARNLRTGNLDVAGSYQQYYNFSNKSSYVKYMETSLVHGLTPELVKQLGAAHMYGDKDAQQLLDFIGDTKVVGHNIWGGDINPHAGFDLKHLFDPGTIKHLEDRGGILDTLMLFQDANGVGSGIKNDLDALFKGYYGKTMEQAGLSHHNAQADVIATMMIMEAASRENTLFGSMIRKAMQPGVTYLGYDEWNMFRRGGKNMGSDDLKDSVTYYHPAGQDHQNDDAMTSDTMQEHTPEELGYSGLLGSSAGIQQTLQLMNETLQGLPTAFENTTRLLNVVAQSNEKSLGSLTAQNSSKLLQLATQYVNLNDTDEYDQFGDLVPGTAKQALQDIFKRNGLWDILNDKGYFEAAQAIKAEKNQTSLNDTWTNLKAKIIGQGGAGWLNDNWTNDDMKSKESMAGLYARWKAERDEQRQSWSRQNSREYIRAHYDAEKAGASDALSILDNIDFKADEEEWVRSMMDASEATQEAKKKNADIQKRQEFIEGQSHYGYDRTDLESRLGEDWRQDWEDLKFARKQNKFQDEFTRRGLAAPQFTSQLDFEERAPSLKETLRQVDKQNEAVKALLNYGYTPDEIKGVSSASPDKWEGAYARFKFERSRDDLAEKYWEAGEDTIAENIHNAKNERELSAFTKGLGDSTRNLYAFNTVVSSISQVLGAVSDTLGTWASANMSLPIWSNVSAAQSATGAFNGVIGAQRGTVPGWFTSMNSRFGTAFGNQLTGEAQQKDYEWEKRINEAKEADARWSKIGAVVGNIGRAASGVGKAVTAIGVVGAIGGSTVAGVGAAPGLIATGAGIGLQGIGGITGQVGKLAEGRVNKARHDQEYAQNMALSYKSQIAGQDFERRFNLLGLAETYALTPLKLLGGALRTTVGLFGKLNKVWASLDNLGRPLTMLTGVTYGNYTGLATMDMAAGLQRGTTNAMYNNWAMSQMNMYNTGQFDLQRVVAASLLGEFSSVYANGGDTQAQIAGTADRLGARLRRASPVEQQRIMTLAATIDQALPQMLQTMQNFGVSYKALTAEAHTYWDKDKQQYVMPSKLGVLVNPLTSAERRRAGMVSTQWQMATGTFSSNVQRLGISAWESFGLKLFNVVNKHFDDIVRTIQSSKLWGWLSDMVDSITGALEGKNSWADVWGSFKIGLKSVTKDLVGTFNIDWKGIGDLISNALKILYNAWDKLLIYMVDSLEGVMNYLKGWHTDPVALVKAIFSGGDIGSAFYYENPNKFRGFNPQQQLEFVDPNGAYSMTWRSLWGNIQANEGMIERTAPVTTGHKNALKQRDIYGRTVTYSNLFSSIEEDNSVLHVGKKEDRQKIYILERLTGAANIFRAANPAATDKDVWKYLRDNEETNPLLHQLYSDNEFKEIDSKLGIGIAGEMVRDYLPKTRVMLENILGQVVEKVTGSKIDWKLSVDLEAKGKNGMKVTKTGESSVTIEGQHELIEATVNTEGIKNALDSQGSGGR